MRKRRGSGGGGGVAAFPDDGHSVIYPCAGKGAQDGTLEMYRVHSGSFSKMRSNYKSSQVIVKSLC